MHWLDWLIMLLPLAICAAIAIYSRRFVKGVADFMAGGRNAGRFLICAARSQQGSGAVVFVATFQGLYQSGLGLGWWGNISVPVSLLLMTTGYVIYRYRETRALSLGQFFEMRYSRRFRLFAGVLGFFAGIVNFGIIPCVGAKCMVFLLELPAQFHLGPWLLPTHVVLMAVFLSLCVLTTTTGGQISVLLTDCAEGMFSQLFYTLIGIIILVAYFKWSATKAMFLDREPTKSLVNPFDAFGIADFNIWMVLMGIVGGNFYRTIAWQNSHAFNSSAASPHEARMGGVLGAWRNFAIGTMVTLLGVYAMTYLHAPQGHAAVQTVLNGVKDETTQDQMRLPTALSQLLPMGIKGMLLSVCLMGIISGDGIHLHSWGSIFIQDVVAPLRQRPSKLQTRIVFGIFELIWFVAGGILFFSFIKPWMMLHYPEQQAGTVWGLLLLWMILGALVFLPFGKLISSDAPLTPRQHILLLRLAIVGVAAWAFVFGWLFPQMKYVGFWWSATEAIFVGGAGIAVVGGLYWSRGTTAGAWAGLFVGFTLSVAGILADLYCRQIISYTPAGHEWMAFGLQLSRNHEFRLNGVQMNFFSGIAACLTYGVVSLLTCRQPHNMNQLLHRGQYAAGAAEAPEPVVAQKPQRNWLYRIVGIDDQFNRMDRWITLGIFWWSMFWFGVFVVGTCAYLVFRQSGHDKDYNGLWATYFMFTGIYLPLVIGAATTIWFTIGCWQDIWVFFRRLKEEAVDVHDDGSVAHGPAKALAGSAAHVAAAAMDEENAVNR